MAFRVGQKVVCVRDEAPEIDIFGIRGNPNWPACVRVGGVFTIRDITTKLAISGLRFAEYHHPLNWAGWETAFPATCFRPLIEKNTDISIFKAMLRKAPKRERIDA